MDINGTNNPDNYDESGNTEYTWHNYYGKDGADTIRMKAGQAIGGRGNDWIEHVGTESWSRLSAAYWDAPAGVQVDLVAGTAQDGWGFVDTLVGVDSVHVGHHNDTVRGSAGDNQFSTGGGTDLFDGRGGNDSIVLGWVAGAPATAASVVFDVSIDGRDVLITAPGDPKYQVTLRDVERITYNWDQPYMEVASLIDPLKMATQGLVGGAGDRWNAASPLGTAVSVSFSFVENSPATGPGATGFRTFTDAERQAVRDILARVSEVANITFVEQAEAGGATGQMRFGVSQQAATKGVAYMPSTTPGLAGDVWMDVDSMTVLTPGSEGYAALLHEVGHALGLRHPRNVDPGDAWTAQWREADDVSSLTVMSDSPSSDGLYRADWGVMDIAALRHLYGMRGTAGESQTYSLGGLDAQAQRTIVDDGGIDVLDASASPVGVLLDLQAGHRSNIGVSTQGLVAVENLAIALGSSIEQAVGSPHDDLLTGNAMDNEIFGGLGNDDIDGGSGLDIAGFAGARADYALSEAYGVRYVEALDGESGFDALVNVERLQFDDLAVALDVAGNPGDWVKLLGVLAGAAMAADPYYRGVGIGYLDGGLPLDVLAGAGLDLILGANANSAAAVVTLLYTNIAGVGPGSSDLAYFSGLISSGSVSREQFALLASEVSYNLANIGFSGLEAGGIDYLV